MSITMTKAS